MPENPELFQPDRDKDGTAYYFTEVTLRDLFAALVVAGVCGNPEHLDAFADTTEAKMRLAGTVYSIADAMLAEREKAK